MEEAFAESEASGGGAGKTNKVDMVTYEQFCAAMNKMRLIKEKQDVSPSSSSRKKKDSTRKKRKKSTTTKEVDRR